MAWKDTLHDASFRGVPFACQQITRDGRRTVAVHEMPYQAGAELEDLNLGARRIRLRAVFWGDDYEDQLAAFIDALEAPGTGELIHPVHGSMTVLADAWDDDHTAEDVDAAVVVVNFIEDAVRELPVFSDRSSAAQVDAIGSGAEDARAAADDALDRFLAQDFSLPRINVLKDAFNQARNVLGRILGVTGAVKLLLSDLDPLIYPRAYAVDLLAMVDRAFQGLPFGGRNTSYAGASMATLPSAATRSGQTDFQTLRAHLDPATVVLLPNVPVPTAAMQADVAVVQAHARVHAATAIAEAASIVLAGELDVPLLNRNDIEQLTGQARAAVQLAIDGARSALDPEARGQTSAALSTLAWQVQEAARAVLNQRPPLVRRASPVSGPLRLVAHAIYGDAARATELAALNVFGRKVLIDKEDLLNAYAR